jgi:uncharacterized protein (DUF433 family)
MSTMSTSHIELDENGVAWIDNTHVKVVEVAIDKIVHGSSPEEMRFQYPHLSLAQIHAALAYYYDHQADLDAEIERRWLNADKLVESVSDASLREKLLALKKTRTEAQLPERTYRRAHEHETWHWCESCSSWPTTDYEDKTSYVRPATGELCRECRAKERADDCRP